MAWVSVEAAKLVGKGFFQTLSQGDLLAEYQPVLESGWEDVDGAIVLKGWHESYFGERSRFSETMDYEISVNGRGIPSFDLPENRDRRISMLLRRGAAFAWAALHVQRNQLPGVKMAAYVTAAPTLMDPSHFTGNVTFCASRLAQVPYIEPAGLTVEIVAALFTEDCEKPLPLR
jgi:hypothetical protein